MERSEVVEEPCVEETVRERGKKYRFNIPHNIRL